MLGQGHRAALQHQDAADLGLVVGEQLLGQGAAEAAPTDHDQVERPPSRPDAG